MSEKEISDIVTKWRRELIHGVMINVLDCSILVSEFEIQSRLTQNAGL